MDFILFAVAEVLLLIAGITLGMALELKRTSKYLERLDKMIDELIEESEGTECK